MDEKETCQFTSKTYQEYQCPHPPWEGDRKGLCIFHSPLVDNKKEIFKKEFEKRLDEIENNADAKEYDFTGYIFPRIEFRSYSFSKKAVFSKCQFLGFADFRESKFLREADFEQNGFLATADFRESKFLGEADFKGSKFSKDADFKQSIFSGSVNFGWSTLSGKADFKNSRFSGNVDFERCEFSGDVAFDWGDFSGSVNFGWSKSFSRFSLKKVTFQSEISFECADIRLLKQLEPNGPNGFDFSDTILHDALFFGMDTIKNVNFKDSFLLSLSLAKKEVVNCDFTGATMDFVYTRSWKPDQQTIDNTKYIYTDCTTETNTDEDGNLRTVYKRVEDSRVPAEGYFGKSNNTGFTIKEFLQEPYIWSRSVFIPTELQTEFKNYIQFFQEFIYATENVSIEIHIRKEGKRLRIEFHTSGLEEKNKVEVHFKRYLLRLKDNKQIVEFNNQKISKEEQSLTIVRLENRIAQLQNDIRHAERFIGLQNQRIRFLENLTINLSGKGDRPINVYVDASSESSSESNPTISVDTTISIQLSELRNQFEELERGLEDGSQEKKAVKDLAKDVDSIKESTSKEELKKSPVMRKLKDFLKGIGKVGELSNSIAAKVDGGMDKIRKIAETYNKLAENCGFDPVKLFVDSL